MNNYLDITKKYLKTQKKRTILTCIGIILSVALICAVGTLLVSFKESELKAAKQDANYHVRLKNVSYDNVKKIRAHLDTEKIGLETQIGNTKLYEAKKEEIEKSGVPRYKYIDIRQVDKEIINMRHINLKSGRFPKNSNEIVIEEWALEYLPKGTKIGDKITLDLGRFLKKETNPKEKNQREDPREDQGEYKEGIKKEFILTGIIKSPYFSNYNSVANGITFSDKYEKDKKYYAYMRIKGKKNPKEYVKEVKNSFNLSNSEKEKIEVYYNNYLLSLEGRGTSEQTNEALFAVVAFIIAIIVVCTIMVIYNIFQISVIERIKQFGILRSIGATPKQIRRIVFKEAAILSIISIPIGLVSGIFAMKVLFIVISKILGKLIDIKLITVISPEVIIISSIVALITIYISAIRPAFTASRVSPLEAIRNNLSSKGKVRKVKSNILINKIFKVEGEIAYKNIKINKKRFIVTIGSMIISIVLFVVFGSMITYGEKFNSFHDMSYQDFKLIKSDGFTDKDYEQVKNIKGIDKIYRIFISENYNVTLNRNNVDKTYLKSIENGENKKDTVDVSTCLNGFDSEELKLCRDKVLSGEVNEDIMNKERGVLVVQNSIVQDSEARKTCMVNIANLKVGDKINLWTKNHEGLSINNEVKVAGILKENPLGKFIPESKIYVIATDKLYKEIERDNKFNGMDLLVNKGADREKILTSLRNMSNSGTHMSIVDTKESIESLKRVNLTMKIFLYGFVTVIALISSLNIINTISTNLMLRKREIAALEAIGMTEKQVRKMVYLEGVLYGIISSIIGAIIGTGLSYLLNKKITQVRGFEWLIPWKFIIIAVVSAMIIALVSSYFPLRRIKNESLIDNIRLEE